jgi:hypothetical protein
MEETGSIELDESHWPLVISTLVGRPTTEIVEAFIENLTRVHTKNERFVSLTFMRLSRPDFAHVARLGAWAKHNQELSRRWNAGSAIVLGSPAMRFIMSAFYLVAVPPSPIAVFEEPEQAKAWLRRRLTEEKMRVPDYLLGGSRGAQTPR